MSKVTLLGSEDIKKLITIPMALEAVEGAYAQKSRGEGGLWPMVFHEFDAGKADLDIKSGELGQTGYFGFKLVSWFGANPDKGLPALFGTAMLFDISTGAPCALLNAGASRRTAPARRQPSGRSTSPARMLRRCSSAAAVSLRRILPPRRSMPCPSSKV